METYELIPKYDSRGSFYRKAVVTITDNKKTLRSYDTDVAYIQNGEVVLNGWYSATTGRHIKEFLLQNGYKAENKKQMLQDYAVAGWNMRTNTIS